MQHVLRLAEPVALVDAPQRELAQQPRFADLACGRQHRALPHQPAVRRRPRAAGSRPAAATSATGDPTGPRRTRRAPAPGCRPPAGAARSSAAARPLRSGTRPQIVKPRHPPAADGWPPGRRARAQTRWRASSAPGRQVPLCDHDPAAAVALLAARHQPAAPRPLAVLVHRQRRIMIERRRLAPATAHARHWRVQRQSPDPPILRVVRLARHPPSLRRQSHQIRGENTPKWAHLRGGRWKKWGACLGSCAGAACLA